MKKFIPKQELFTSEFEMFACTRIFKATRGGGSLLVHKLLPYKSPTFCFPARNFFSTQGEAPKKDEFAINEKEFMKICEDYLHKLIDSYEGRDDLVHDLDSTHDSIKIESIQKGKIIVVNRQVPNRQIWYSSPVR